MQRTIRSSIVPLPSISTNQTSCRYWKFTTSPPLMLCIASNVLNGTPMGGTHLPLRPWFGAIYLTAKSSTSISAMVLSRQLDIGYKTAWFLAHRIRKLRTRNWEAPRGLVEVDEEYLGGKGRKKNQTSRRDADDDQQRGRAGTPKAMVVAASSAVERPSTGACCAGYCRAHGWRSAPHGQRTRGRSRPRFPEGQEEVHQ